MMYIMMKDLGACLTKMGTQRVSLTLYHMRNLLLFNHTQQTSKQNIDIVRVHLKKKTKKIKNNEETKTYAPVISLYQV